MAAASKQIALRADALSRRVRLRSIRGSLQNIIIRCLVSAESFYSLCPPPPVPPGFFFGVLPLVMTRQCGEEPQKRHLKSATWAAWCVDTASVDMLMHYICLCQYKPTYFHSKGQQEIVAMSAYGKNGSPLISVGSASLPPCGENGNCICIIF